MDFEASFEAKLHEHLEAIAAGADAAKRRLADGIAGVRPPEPSAAPPPSLRSPSEPPPKRTGPAVSFEGLDDEGIPVWEEPA